MQANLTNPDGTTNVPGVVAEWTAWLRDDPDVIARANAYDAWFYTAQSLGRLPKYGWQADDHATPYSEYLSQLLNPGGELLSPTGLVTAATVPLPSPAAANVIARLGWITLPAEKSQA